MFETLRCGYFNMKHGYLFHQLPPRVLQLIMTFILCATVLAVTSKYNCKNALHTESLAPLAIGIAGNYICSFISPHLPFYDEMMKQTHSR